MFGDKKEAAPETAEPKVRTSHISDVLNFVRMSPNVTAKEISAGLSYQMPYGESITVADVQVALDELLAAGTLVYSNRIAENPPSYRRYTLTAAEPQPVIKPYESHDTLLNREAWARRRAELAQTTEKPR